MPHRISERAPWSPSQELAKYVTPEFAYAVWLERRKAKMGGRGEATPVTLRVTMIFRPEDGTWRVLHHHADPTATPRPAETVIQE